MTDTPVTSGDQITAALNEAYERGQRDMRDRCTTVAVAQCGGHHFAVQCGGGFHDRKRLRSAIAALPITPEKEGGE